MSIVACPQCGKRISNLAPICDHCGHRSGTVQEEDLDRFRARKLRDQIYRLNMVSYSTMAAALLAFGWYWIGTGGLQMPLNTRGPIYLMGVSVVAYLVVRVLLFRARQQRKANRRRANETTH
jgi:hypothetical protein